MAAPRRAITTQAEWDVRALELFEAEVVVHPARLVSERRPEAVGEDIIVERTFSVRSATCGLDHTVRHDAQSGATCCDCTAGHYGRPCRHAGAVLAWVRRASRVQGASELEGEAWFAFQMLYED